jgi:hypothetical protein
MANAIFFAVTGLVNATPASTAQEFTSSVNSAIRSYLTIASSAGTRLPLRLPIAAGLSRSLQSVASISGDGVASAAEKQI